MTSLGSGPWKLGPERHDHPLKGATVNPPMGFRADFGGSANFFEAFSEIFRIYKRKTA